MRLALLTALGLILRLAVLLAFEEAPGDGPSRAIQGWHWFRDPGLSFDGNWLPGHEILIGLVLHLVRDPAWGGRLLSLAAGTATIPLLLVLTRRLFGTYAAMVAALLLAVLPMHVALSATSLAEPVALALLLGLLLAAFRVADGSGGVGSWLAIAFCAAAGTSLRYELWLALPVVTLHHLLRTRSWRRTGLMALLMLPFPALWLTGRAARGGLVGAYTGTVAGVESVGAQAVDLAVGLAAFAGTMTALAGMPLLMLAVLGAVALATPGLTTTPARADRLALLALVLLETALLIRLATDLGEAFWPRYPAALVVLLLPFAGQALAACLRPSLVRHTALVIALLAMLQAAWSEQPRLYLVPEIPAATREAAAWVAGLPAGEPVLMTRMSWQSSYIPLLAGLDWQRYRIISYWLPDADLRYFVERRRPAFVITRETDQPFLERLCRLTGLAARLDRPLARFDRIVAAPLEPGDCVDHGSLPG